MLITSGQPSLNPRLVKEADILCSSGFDVTVLYQYWNEWGSVMDEPLLSGRSWKAIRVGGHPRTGRFKYWQSRIVHRIAQFLVHKLQLNDGLAELALSRSSRDLQRKAKRIKASLYIAHNLGALPAAVFAAETNKAKCAFDAEDFHRQEISDDCNSMAYRLSKFIEDKYLTKVNYCTAASPLIAQAYQTLYSSLGIKVINNVFPSSSLQQVTSASPHGQLDLFWFSQTIGKGRGLEDAIAALGMLKKNHINLVLLGSIDDHTKSYFLSLATNLGIDHKQLTFLSPVSPDQVFEIANKCDLGLALEQDRPHNRNICLTNKIFTYLTAGLAVIATETLAQKGFIDQHPDIGRSFPIGDVEKLALIIRDYDQDRAALYQTRLRSLQLAKEHFNWETEGKKFISIVKETVEF